MDNQESNGVSIKDSPVYHWHDKEEGKEEYARFAKQFKLSLKQLRYVLEPGGVQRGVQEESAMSWSTSRPGASPSSAPQGMERRYGPIQGSRPVGGALRSRPERP